MSVCAVMLVKDEADVIYPVLQHLSSQVQEIIVADNGSTDGTREILHSTPGVIALDDKDPAYWQARKTTKLATLALARGHEWVIPCDADEVWYANGRTLTQFVEGVAPDVAFVTAELYNHIPTAKDPADEPNPLLRIGYRQREHGNLGKIACRLRPGLEIHAGNHNAWAPGTGVRVPGLIIRHFSWRTSAQYVRKIRNGAKAYAATDLPADIGAHWRMWEERSDAEIAEHFRQWFWRDDPDADASLIYDPAPLGSNSPS